MCENEDSPKLFAVIDVTGDYYGGIDEVKCDGVYRTYEEAEAHVDRHGGYVVVLTGFTELMEKIK